MLNAVAGENADRRSGDGYPRPVVDADGQPSAAQQRIVVAALDLFSEHGVGGTSLAMIAGRVGVTKAAIFHQYPAKQDIVRAVAESELARVIEVIEQVDQEEDPERARDALLVAMVDLVVERGRRVSTLLSDPVIGQLFADHEPFREAMERLSRLLHGGRPSRSQFVQTMILIAAMSGALDAPLQRRHRRRPAPSPASPARPAVPGNR